MPYEDDICDHPYNSEAYIKQCVRSLINQSYHYWEALLIDDGSADRSLELCGQIRASALRECGRPLFRSVDFLHKSLFCLCFKCYPLYAPVSRAAGVVWTLKEKGGEKR